MKREWSYLLPSDSLLHDLSSDFYFYTNLFSRKFNLYKTTNWLTNRFQIIFKWSWFCYQQTGFVWKPNQSFFAIDKECHGKINLWTKRNYLVLARRPSDFIIDRRRFFAGTPRPGKKPGWTIRTFQSIRFHYYFGAVIAGNFFDKKKTQDYYYTPTPSRTLTKSHALAQGTATMLIIKMTSRGNRFLTPCHRQHIVRRENTETLLEARVLFYRFIFGRCRHACSP